MKKKILLLILFILSFSSQATHFISQDRVENENDCFSWVFSDFDIWRNQLKKKYQINGYSKDLIKIKIKQFDSKFSREAFYNYKNILECSTFDYRVDNLMVKGYIIKPKVAKKLPVLIYNRGGNGNYGSVVLGSMMLNLFPISVEGFAIIGSQYRGSLTKSDVLDEFGGADVNDVLALLDLIPSIKGVDSSRVGMFGASRGSMQTHLAVKETNAIKAIATIAGNINLLDDLTYRPAMEKVYMKRIPNYLENKKEELNKRSVSNWVHKLSPNIPILLLHGMNDKLVSAKHSIDFANSLSKYNIPHKLVLYPDDNHGLMKNKQRSNAEIVQWFKMHL